MIWNKGLTCLFEQTALIRIVSIRRLCGVSRLAKEAGLPENVVFVVDDDPAMLRSLARLLRQFGYDSLLFPSAEAFTNHSDFGNAACVVLDINLGDVSGIDLRHRLRVANASVPVIFITGNDKPAVREAALQSGCVAYLTKPFSAKSLIEPIKELSISRSRHGPQR